MSKTRELVLSIANKIRSKQPDRVWSEVTKSGIVVPLSVVAYILRTAA